jgi:hypothetical protein
MENKQTQAERNSNGGNDSEIITERSIHPAWLALIRYCRELRHGELDRLSIQDGVPVIAESVRHKVKFKP